VENQCNGCAARPAYHFCAKWLRIAHGIQISRPTRANEDQDANGTRRTALRVSRSEEWNIGRISTEASRQGILEWQPRSRTRVFTIVGKRCLRFRPSANGKLQNVPWFWANGRTRTPRSHADQSCAREFCRIVVRLNPDWNFGAGKKTNSHGDA